MRQPRIHHYCWVAFLLWASIAQAQKGDWRAVKELPPGTTISVKSGHFFGHDPLCLFVRATDDRLVCQVLLHGPSRIFLPSEAVYSRKKILDVRIEHSEDSNVLAGAAIGGGVGAGLGAATFSTGRGAGALLFGLGGAAIGGLVGRDFPVFHGKVIYRR
jgi:hypothetical protein